MTTRPTQTDEIDLFDVIEQLWRAKLTILLFCVVAMFLAAIYAITSEKKFESQVNFKIDTIPPFYTADKTLVDFEKLFYEKVIFDDWKKNQSDTSIEFDQFSAEQIVDGVKVAKTVANRLAALSNRSSNSSVLVIKSNKLAVLNDFFEYSQHVNQLLKSDYVSRARSELEIYEARFNDLKASNESIIRNVLSIDRYIVAAERGANVLKISRPTLPSRKSIQLPVILVISIVMGIGVGALYVLASNAWRKHMEAAQ